MKLRTILVPTDFTDQANNALAVAASLARKGNAELLLLHVIDVPVNSSSRSGIGSVGASSNEEIDPLGVYMPKVVERTKERLNNLMAQYSDVPVRKHVVFDDEARDLVDFVLGENADLIVVGSKDADTLDDVRLSDNVEKIMRLARCPVLTVKQKITNAANLGNIVFASDFKDVPTGAIEDLRSVQMLFDSTVHFVKIIPPRAELSVQKDTLDLISAFATRNHFENYTVNIYSGESKEMAIRKFAESVKAELIAMTVSGRTGIAHFLFGNLTEKVANNARRSMLTFSERGY